jgi:peptide/nickel transport system permease protein
MGRYAIQRLLAAIPVLFGVTVIVFFLIRLVPGDVITTQFVEMGRISDADRERLEQELGLDRPLLVQFADYMGGVVRGDLGNSLWTREPVIDRILASTGVTVQLAVMGVLIGVLVAIPLGVISAIYRDSPLDYSSRLFAIAGLSMPDFWIATMLILYMSTWFSYIPPVSYVGFFDDPWRNFQIMILPALVLGVRMAAVIARMARSTMLEVLGEDYIRTARAKGAREQAVVVRHAMRNAMIPVVTIIGSQFAYLLGGTIVLELVFSIPGLGSLTLDAVRNRDYTQVQGNVLFFALAIVLMNLIVDLSYGWLDPRIRMGQ